MDKLQESLVFIENNKVYRVVVGLHLHFDKDEDYDYTGMHSIDTSVRVKRFDDMINAERFVDHCHTIDLEGVSIEECRLKHTEVYESVSKAYGSAVKREFTHR